MIMWYMCVSIYDYILLYTDKITYAFSCLLFKNTVKFARFGFLNILDMIK